MEIRIIEDVLYQYTHNYVLRIIFIRVKYCIAEIIMIIIIVYYNTAGTGIVLS